MEIYNYNNNFKGILTCKKCHTYYLLELLTNEKDILLRKYCFCGESTSQINSNMKMDLMQDFNFYKNYKCKCIPEMGDNIDEKKTISKYCNECNEYLCKDCIKNHNHTNLISPNLFLVNCKLHPKEKLIGFCRKCTKPLCQKCANDFHRNHDIRYAKQLNKFIIEKYQDNLLKAISEYNKLIKLKYSQNMELTISNLSSSQNLPLIDFEDKQIIITLEILKTMFDLYIYHNNNGSLNYQLITNILKHINFEIIRLPDKSNVTEDSSSKNKYLNINNASNKSIKDNINKNIVIHLQIDLNDEEQRTKKINILSSKNLKFCENANKMIILKSGDLAFSCYFELQILKNLKDISTIKSDGQINDFIQLENENLALLSSQGNCSRNWINILEIFDVKNNFKRIKEICLQPFERNKRYCKIISYDNNFVLLSYSIIDQKINITYLNSQDYKEIKLLELEGKIGNIIYINGYIIITTSIPREMLKIYFYDFQNRILEKCLSLIKAGDKFFDIFSLHTPINNFFINNEKILLSTELYGLIINVKTKQIESKIENFKNIYCISNLNDYLLAGFNNGIISQIKIETLEISNNFITSLDKESSSKEIVSIVDIGNNQFCALLYNNGLYIFNYK